MRWAIVVIVWMLSAVVLAPLCFFVVMVLAGPHSSMLPSAIQPAVLVAGWMLFLVGPVLLARVAWRRASRWSAW
jgi:hypothetical protein